MDMDLTTIYTDRYQWKYNIKRPFQNKSKTTKMYTTDGKSEMLDLVFRCTVSFVKDRISFVHAKIDIQSIYLYNLEDC